MEADPDPCSAALHVYLDVHAHRRRGAEGAIRAATSPKHLDGWETCWEALRRALGHDRYSYRP